MITFPLWFNIILALFTLHLVFYCVIFLIKGKMINYYKEFSIEKKEKLISKFSKRLKFQKHTIWLILLNVFIMPALIYMLAPELFYHITILNVVLSVGVLIEFFYVKAVLRELKT